MSCEGANGVVGWYVEVCAPLCRLRIHEEGTKALQAVRAAPNADAIIISDANSVFINTILEECGAADVFSAVLTNPASFNSKGLMSVEWHHTHTCQLCTATPNMCKGEPPQPCFMWDQVLYVPQVPFSGNISRTLHTFTPK